MPDPTKKAEAISFFPQARKTTDFEISLDSLVPLPLPGNSSVNGQKHRIKSALLDFAQHGLARLSIAVHVKLEEKGLLCRRPSGHDFLDGARCIVRDGLDDPLRRTGAHDIYLTAWVAETREGCRRDEDGKRAREGEDRRVGRDFGDFV